MQFTSTVRICLLIVIAFVSNRMMSAQTDVCTTRARHIINELRSIQDWDGLHGSFERFRSCDKARIAEEFSYTISRLLARHWDSVEELVRLSEADKEFKAFILRHIDENIPEEEGQLIERNCREHPPAGGDWLCKAVVDY
jgi:hypothetical protein